MIQRMIPGFSSISQFGPHLPNDICGPTATLSALHRPLDPQGYQLDNAGLQKIYHFELQHALCEANGAQNIFSVYRAVQLLLPNPAHTLVDYAGYATARFVADIRAWAGLRAIIIEYANGQALTGDEIGLHFHFNSIGGIDSLRPVEGEIGGYATCDGDSRSDLQNNEATPPIWHTRQTLELAQPIAYVICAGTA